MNMFDVTKPLEEYRELTVRMIEKAKNGEDLSELINERGLLIEELRNHDYDKNELKKYIESLEIINLDNELRLVVKKEMVNIKRQIEKIRAVRIARNGYINTSEKVKLFMNKA